MISVGTSSQSGSALSGPLPHESGWSGGYPDSSAKLLTAADCARSFSAPGTGDFGGRVVIARSQTTRKINKVESSMQYLEDLVTSQLPETAKIVLDEAALRTEVLESIEAP